MAGEPNTTEPSKVVTSLYPRGRGTKDLSASFSSSLCSRFVKMIIKIGQKYEKREPGWLPPPSSVHCSKKGAYPGNPVPPNQAGQAPDPGQTLGSLKCDPFFAPHGLFEGRLKGFLHPFPRPPSRRFASGGLLLCSGSSVLKDLGVEFRMIAGRLRQGKIARRQWRECHILRFCLVRVPSPDRSAVC